MSSALHLCSVMLDEGASKGFAPEARMRFISLSKWQVLNARRSDLTSVHAGRAAWYSAWMLSKKAMFSGWVWFSNPAAGIDMTKAETSSWGVLGSTLDVNLRSNLAACFLNSGGANAIILASHLLIVPITFLPLSDEIRGDVMSVCCGVAWKRLYVHFTAMTDPSTCVHCGRGDSRLVYIQGRRLVVCTGCFPLDAVLCSEMYDMGAVVAHRVDAHAQYIAGFKACIVVTYRESSGNRDAPRYPRTFLHEDVFLVDIPPGLADTGHLPVFDSITLDHCNSPDALTLQKLAMSSYQLPTQWAIKRVLQFLGQYTADPSVPVNVRYAKLSAPKRMCMCPFVSRQVVYAPGSDCTMLGVISIERVV